MTYTTEQLEAMVAAANARADQARDAALVEAAGTLEVQALDTDAQAKRFRGGSDPWADRTARSRALRNSAAAILALRDKPVPAVTVQGELQESREYAQALEVELRDRTAKIERECKLAEAQVSRLLDLTNRMDDRLNALVSATEALGAMPEGYCFCSENRIGDDSKTHEPECEGLRSALRAIAGGGDE